MNIPESLAFVIQIYDNQKRDTPLAHCISHLLVVAGTVQAMGASEEEVIAALLHHLLEDTTITYEEISTRFGATITPLILECTEIGSTMFRKPKWQIRKEMYLDHIELLSPAALLITIADKLQSIHELWREYRDNGDSAFTNRVQDVDTLAEKKECTLWFNEQLFTFFTHRLFALRKSRHLTQEQQQLLKGCGVLLNDFTEEVQKFLEEDTTNA